MKILAFDWSNFWQSIGDAFVAGWEQFVNFWFSAEDGNTPYLVTFSLGLIFLVVGVVIIRIILVLIRKGLKLDKDFVKEKTIKRFLFNTIKFVLYILLFLIFLSILKVDMSGTSTIISSAILAIGLSLQDVVGNFASGLIIVNTKLFVIGEYIDIGGLVEGIVEDVSFLNTRLKTIDGQSVTVPNSTITRSYIKNYSRNAVRRININLGVDYNTDIELAKKVLLDICQNDKRIMQEPAPQAVVTEFKEYSLNLSLRCHVPTQVYWTVLFDLNEKILYAFRENKISIAFPRVALSSPTGNSVIVEKSKGSSE
ncbi:MAG: mechanosensitive ion channel family protein [Bacilli bacterium]|nr:mechanosensitive ion channel family protein [Bacilli bacterium]